MATAYKYNIGKKIELANGSKGIVISNGKHAYTVEKTNGETDSVWGFNIKDNSAKILIEEKEIKT